MAAASFELLPKHAHFNVFRLIDEIAFDISIGDSIPVTAQNLQKR